MVSRQSWVWAKRQTKWGRPKGSALRDGDYTGPRRKRQSRKGYHTVYIKLSVGEEPSFMIRSRAATVSVSPYVYQFCRIKIPTPNQETICNCQERKNSFSLIEYQWVYQLFSRAGPMSMNSWSKQSRLHGVCTHMYLYFCYILFSLTFSAVSFSFFFF